MTNSEYDRISRSWVGHVATDPAVREKMNAAKNRADLADLINQTVIPKDNVTAADIPEIQKRVMAMFPPEIQDPGSDQGILQFHRQMNP